MYCEEPPSDTYPLLVEKLKYLFTITNISLGAIPVLVSDGLESFASQAERVAGIELADVLVKTSLK